MTYQNIDIKQNSKFVSLRHTKTLNIEIWTQKFKINDNSSKHRIKPRPLEHHIKIQLSNAANSQPRPHRIKISTRNGNKSIDSAYTTSIQMLNLI